jgi:rhodanese-related sulfurtransferase
MMAKGLALREGSLAPGGLAAPRVSVDEVLARLDRGEQIAFVDARRDEEWRSSDQRLPGAVRLSPEGKEETLPLIAPNRAVVTYCTCVHEASAATVAEMLMARGYKDVHPLYGGLEAWRSAGGPMEPKGGREET